MGKDNRSHIKSVINHTTSNRKNITIPEPATKAGRPIPVFWIRASRTTRGVDYSECNTKRGKSEKFLENSLKNLTQPTYQGKPDKAARQTIIDTINDIATHSRLKTAINPKTNKEFNLTTVFITLTLPVKQFHEDQTITRKILKPFLEKLQRKHQMNSYIWKAEIQPYSTGNIHYHILTNIFINHRDIRRTWNDCLEKLNYVTEYRKNKKPEDSFEPPTTQIKKTYDVKNIAAYAAKYMAKPDKPNSKIRKVEGAVWNRSDNLTKIEPLKIVAGPETDQEFDMLIHNNKIQTSDPEICPYVKCGYFNIFKTDLKLYPAFQKAIKKEAIRLRSIIDPEPKPTNNKLFHTGNTFSGTRTQQGFQKNVCDRTELKDKRRDNHKNLTQFPLTDYSVP